MAQYGFGHCRFRQGRYRISSRMPKPPPPGLAPDSHAFRESMSRFATGVTIMTTWDAARAPVGLTVNSFNSVSLHPPLVLWSLAKQSKSFPAFEVSRHYCVNILAADQQPLAEHFSRFKGDRFAGLTLDAARDAPRLPGCAAYFDCRLRSLYDEGDHIILVGEVLGCEYSAQPTLVYFAHDYRTLAP